MRVPLRFLLVAGVLTLALVVGGVLLLGGEGGDDDATPAPREAPFEAVPLSEYDATSAVVARAPFCDALDERAVEAVVGSVPTPQTWANGDTLDVGTGQPDVVHEFGCSFAAPSVAEARAWVFAPPVDATRADRLVRAAGKAAGCTPGTGPAFGAPTLALTCTAEDGAARASYRGLFVVAWVVCVVTRPPGAAADVAARPGRCCLAVLTAAGAES